MEGVWPGASTALRVEKELSLFSISEGLVFSVNPGVEGNGDDDGEANQGLEVIVVKLELCQRLLKLKLNQQSG